MKFLAASFFVIVLVVPSTSLCQQIDRKSAPDKVTLVYLLTHRLYQPLTEKLDNFAKISAQDIQYEDYLWRAFTTFENPDPSLEPYFNEWIEQFPQSPNAFAARSTYFMAVGWNIRGYGWAKNVSDEQWAGMKEYFVKALTDASSGLKLDPKNVTCYDVIIKMCMHTADRAVTRRALDEALAVSPSSLQLRLTYMWSLLPRWGGSHEEMLAFAQESEQYAKNNPQLHCLRGYIPFDEGWDTEYSGDYRAAITLFNKALSYGDRWIFLEHRGDCYYNLQDYQHAMDDYLQALKLWPQDVNLLRKLGQTLYRLKRVDDARLAIEAAADIAPLDKNVQTWNDALKSDKVEAYDHAKKGFDLAKAGKHEEAIIEYDQAIKIQPDNYLTYYNRGVSYSRLGRLDEAVSDFERALARNANDNKSYDNIGWARQQQNRLDESIDAYSRAITIKSDDAKAYYNRSNAYYKKGRIEEAVNDLRRACELGLPEGCERYKQLQSK